MAAARRSEPFGWRRRPGELLLRIVQAPGRGAWHSLVELVTDDMPFLVDTLTMHIEQAGFSVRGIAHPILFVERDARGLLRGRFMRPAPTRRAESWQRIRIEPAAGPAEALALEQRLRAALADVRAADRDRAAMRAALQESVAQVREAKRASRELRRESAGFLKWLAADNFVFLGMRDSRVRGTGQRTRLAPVPGSTLGILRNRREHPPEHERRNRIRPQDLHRHARSRTLLLLTKGNSISTVHRADHLDYVGIKRFDDRGRLVGERRFLGLWASAVQREDPREVPLLRMKVERILRRFAFVPGSHAAKRLLDIIETLPRDELLQASIADLTRFTRAILGLEENRRVLLLTRRDEFRRFHICLVFIPRDHYDERVRERVERALMAGLNGYRVTTDVDVFDASLVRLHLMVRSEPWARDQRVDEAALARSVEAAAITWRDELRAALRSAWGEERAHAALARWAARFPAAYQGEVRPLDALPDIESLERLAAAPNTPQLRLHRRTGRRSSHLDLAIVKRGAPFEVSDLVPVLESFGLRMLAERPYQLTPAGGDAAAPPTWIQDFELELALPGGVHGEPLQRATAFTTALQLALAGAIETDGFNGLLFAAALDARELLVVRAYCRYLLQAGLPFSQDYVEGALARNAPMVRLLWRLFTARLDPALPRARATREGRRVLQLLDAALAKVPSLDEDRILRGCLQAVRATLRTNYFQRDAHGAQRECLALKLDPRAMPELLPRPLPRFEIFVHSIRVEGVHLRMGPVARGGIRWSDRPQDFRTEILGLMKAQHVKNSLIVPVGAKGGFVVRRAPAAAADRAVLQAEGVACYSLYIRSLLEVTDNIVGARTVPPGETVRHDGDDPYLVVAADKGTASFSDLANTISAERSFWLGDAFASGGSAGYDHKRMGITARGAWECVRRHFRELGLDIQQREFTVAGIGDMSGDVFGNGMLLSEHIRLKAAFDHRHVFLDPDPDAAVSFAERARIAALPRSSWEDYDRRRLSPGGGVYGRNAKAIKLSPQARDMLAATLAGRRSATPAEVIRAILRMQVDLLWNGGIGTFIKAAGESHQQAGDRANDTVRVDGREVGARVIGEGGNLGCTQRGRIEYALRGGRINTDSLDNSAGVNTSDVEVNYKILLDGAGAARQTRGARNRLLARVTPQVASQVLRNNYLQSQAVSVMERESPARLAEYRTLMRTLARNEGLDPALEQLPDEEAFAERTRRGQGLVRPELSVLLSWSKLALNRQLEDSDVPDDPWFAQELERYFAAPIRARHGRRIRRHPLRREIVATATSNSVANRMGAAFVAVMGEATGATPAQVTRAYTIAREALQMRDLWERIEQLDGSVPAAAQYAALSQTTRLLKHLCFWLLLRRRSALQVRDNVAALHVDAQRLAARVADLVAGEEAHHLQERRQLLLQEGLGPELAGRISALDALKSSFDLHEAARAARVRIEAAATVYFGLGAALGVDWLRYRVEALRSGGTWDAAARAALRDGTFAIQRRLTEQALRARGKPAQRLAAWLQAHAAAARSWERMLAELKAAPQVDFASLSVGIDALRKLAASN